MEKKNEIELKEAIWILCRILLIGVFILLSIYGNFAHERWGDEAQAWLLARDARVTDILFTYASPEGSPMLWHLILKLAIMLGLEYSFFWVIPLGFNILGLILLEFKLKLPWYIKVFLPFTYYILYQYNIVARSYCMLFPALCYLAMVYPKRHEKPSLYAIGLALLTSISLHGCILSGTLFILYFIEYVARRMKEEKSIRSFFLETKVWTPFLLLGFYYCFIIFTLIPDTILPIFQRNNQINFFMRAVEIVGEASIRSSITEAWVNFLGIALVIGITGLLTFRAHKKERKMVLLILPLGILFLFYYCNAWHVGILTETLLFVWYILYQGMSEKTKQWEKVVLFICVEFMIIIQVLWSGKAIVEEKSKVYSMGERIAALLQEPVEQGKKIYGIDYSITAILPYFDKNIFANFPNPDESFYHWKTQEGTITEVEELLEGEADIYVISEAYLPYYVKLIEKLEEKRYTMSRYSSALLVKGNAYEYSGYVIATKENP